MEDKIKELKSRKKELEGQMSDPRQSGGQAGFSMSEDNVKISQEHSEISEILEIWEKLQKTEKTC